jgi:hypothetical protein
MKQFLTLLCVLSSVLAYSQTSFRVGLQSYINNELYDVVQLNDGSYVGVGYTESTGSDSDYVYIVKLNAQGQLLSSKTIFGSEAGYTEGIAIIKTADGNIAVSGTLNDQIALYKFDANINLIWYKQYGTNTDYGYATRVIQTSDGGYLIGGYVENSESAGNLDAGCLIKTTSDGTVSWAKQYFDLYDSEITDVVSTKDGNYAFLASFYSVTNDEHDTTYLVKINSTGNIIWSKYVNTNFLDLDGISLITASDGGFVVCGAISTFDTSGNSNNYFDNAMLLKFNKDGNLLWSKINTNDSTNDSYLFGVAEDNDGGYISSGEVITTVEVNNSFNSIEQPYLIKVNSGGVLQWTKTSADMNIHSYFDDLFRTSDGGCIAAGKSYSSDVEYGSLYKFNPDFNICGDAGPYGNLIDLTANTADISLPVSDIPATVFSDNITISDVGTLTNICLLLPSQLLSFNATLQNKTVQLQWKTGNEINTDHFVVERSSNSTSFKALQQLKAAGNSTNVKTYAITDAQPLPGTSYYRLKQVDKDGSFTYSKIASVTVNANGTIIISPNPVHTNINLLLQSTTTGKASILVTDITGKVVITQQAPITTGANNITIPAASLSKGMYILKVIQSDKIQSVKFIKQ